MARVGKDEEKKGFENQSNTEIIGEVIQVAGMVADNIVQRNSIR